MIQMINKLKKNQKGFTLVELIVVLVILAILAAFTIPAMLGFVDDARGKAAIAQAREVYMAYQSATTDVISVGGAAKDQEYYVATTGTTPAPANTTASYPALVQNNAMNMMGGDLTVAGTESGGTYTPPTVTQGVEYGVKVVDGKVTKVEFLRNGYLITLETGATDGGAIVTKGGSVAIGKTVSP